MNEQRDRIIERLYDGKPRRVAAVRADLFALRYFEAVERDFARAHDLPVPAAQRPVDSGSPEE